MLNVKDSLCVGGTSAKPCEDAVGYGETYCFVIDGASGLSKINIVDEKSDAAWFATQVKGKLCSRLDHDHETPTNAILSEIISGINEEYHKIALEKGIKPPSDSPSAGIAVLRKMGERIVFYGLGDCTGIVQTTDGKIEVLKDSRLCALDSGVLERMAEIHRETGMDVLEAREKCNDLLLANRNKRNKEDGYWILDLSGIGVEHAITCSWPENSIESFSCCSDGFAQLVDTFGIYEDYAELLEAAKKTPLTSLCDVLFKAQDKDPQANQFPRFKLRDDTSCLWGEIK